MHGLVQSVRAVTVTILPINGRNLPAIRRLGLSVTDNLPAHGPEWARWNLMHLRSNSCEFVRRDLDFAALGHVRSLLCNFRRSEFAFAISTDLNSTVTGTTILYTPDMVVPDPNYSINDPVPSIHDVVLLHFATGHSGHVIFVSTTIRTRIQTRTPVWVVGYGYDDHTNSEGRKEIAEYVQPPTKPNVLDPNGVAIPNGPCEYDFGDAWWLRHTDGFPLVIGLVTAMTVGTCGGNAYAIPMVGEITFITSHVSDACLTSTLGPPCEGIFRDEFIDL